MEKENFYTTIKNSAIIADIYYVSHSCFYNGVNLFSQYRVRPIERISTRYYIPNFGLKKSIFFRHYKQTIETETLSSYNCFDDKLAVIEE